MFMTSADLISMYEGIAKITSQMLVAARTNDWDVLSRLEDQCTEQTGRIEGCKLPELTGVQRLRKVDLLKQILANDRAIREITEPWMAQVASAMQGSSKQYAATH
jgi:flagellar protein FliT